MAEPILSYNPEAAASARAGIPVVRDEYQKILGAIGKTPDTRMDRLSKLVATVPGSGRKKLSSQSVGLRENLSNVANDQRTSRAFQDAARKAEISGRIAEDTFNEDQYRINDYVRYMNAIREYNQAKDQEPTLFEQLLGAAGSFL